MAKKEKFKLYLEGFPRDVTQAICNVTGISPDDIKYDYSYDTKHDFDVMCMFSSNDSLKSLKPYGLERSINTVRIAEALYMGLNISFCHDKLKSYKDNDKRSKLNLEFRGISIQFFHEDNIICKAEWSNDYPDDIKKMHPQPHWHFIKDATEEDELLQSEDSREGDFNDMITEDGDGGFDPDAEVVENEPKDTFNILRMHFAIDSQWHRGRMQREIIFPTKQILLNWIECCIESVIIEHGFKL